MPKLVLRGMRFIPAMHRVVATTMGRISVKSMCVPVHTYTLYLKLYIPDIYIGNVFRIYIYTPYIYIYIRYVCIYIYNMHES